MTASSLRAASAAVEVVASAHGWTPPSASIQPLPKADDELLARTEEIWAQLAPSGPGPYAVGALYEALLAPAARDAGAHYTSPDLANRLVSVSAGPLLEQGPTPLKVWDPACGGGAFLLAAADALAASGVDPTTVAAECLWGCDIDPGAVAVTRVALAWWEELSGAEPATAALEAHVVVADALLDRPFPEGTEFDLVVGNPPFQGQLAGSVVRRPEHTAALRARWGDVVAPYTDSATLFLLAGARSLAPGGRLVLVQPTSVLSARDAGPTRVALVEVASLAGLWVAAEPVFAAEVDVCAPVLVNGPATAGVQRWWGRAVEPIGGPGTIAENANKSWAALALPALGVPEVDHRHQGQLGDMARLTAGFRDEYYGLVDHVTEAPDGLHLGADWPDHLAPLITSGLIEAGWCAWDSRSTRFGGRRIERPVVDHRSLGAAGGRAHRWVLATAMPKVIVATQTRVGEATVDRRGAWVPSTPTVAVLAPEADLWRIAAVVCSPVGTVAALKATAGAARSSLAIKHSVASVGGLPLPVDDVAWQLGADALRNGDEDGFVAAMAAAYAVDDTHEVHHWWRERVPWRPSNGCQDGGSVA